jgi:glycosyltransferase involved in cell wall biosynthesis
VTRLSACVIACNEESVLTRCLDSIAWADELIIVVDAKSRDRTEEIARQRAARVEVRTYEGDIEQKRYCTELASHDWVLIVDPDEVVTERLAGELQQVLRSEAAVAGYEINRITFHLGRWVRHGDFFPDWKLRLFRRSAARWVGSNPHGRVEVEGGLRRLDGEIEHYSYVDLADHVSRIQNFSTMAAQGMFKAGRKVALSDLVLRPPARFARAYLLKAGFRDGMAGFIIAAATSFYVFLKYAKLWELAFGESNSQQGMTQQSTKSAPRKALQRANDDASGEARRSARP